jgi:alpha-tubulin suppressor-like RCC1 family protein
VKVTAVTSGLQYTCALTTTAGVQCWGADGYGQLGNGATATGATSLPVAVTGLSSGVTAVAAGQRHACAGAAGGVQCWGWNAYGQLGNNSTTDSAVPVTVSGLSSPIKALAAGYGQTCALTMAGGVLCWGWNNAGQLGNSSMADSSVPVTPTGLSAGVKAIAAGYYHTCAVTAAGGVMCWGGNTNGQLGNNSTTQSLVPVAVMGLSSGVVAITAGYGHTCALTSGGAVQCWGVNGAGQLGNNSTMQSLVPIAVTGLSSGVAAISAGNQHTCALTTTGGLQCWGDSSEGQLGNNTMTQSLVPVGVSGLSSGVAAVGAGITHTCAVTTAGGVQCWGDNTYGGLGNNSTMLSLVPVGVVEP